MANGPATPDIQAQNLTQYTKDLTRLPAAALFVQGWIRLSGAWKVALRGGAAATLHQPSRPHDPCCTACPVPAA